MDFVPQFITWIGNLFSNLVAPLLNWIIEPDVGPGLASVILIVAALIIIQLLVSYIEDWFLIRKAIKILDPYQTEKSFSESFNTIDQKLSSVKKINIAWGEFTETLILPKEDGEGKITACANTERPHDFFTLDLLGMGPSFAKALPNIFIGVGLSLTFLGLIAALTEAVGTISSLGTNTADQTTNVQQAITQLLLASSAKFYASLFALFSSIILTLELKAASHLLHRALHKLNVTIEHGVRFQTIEILSRDTNEILEKQLQQLQTFNTDLAMKIGDQLKETFQPIFTKIESIGGDITESNIENMKNISQGIADGIQEATKDSMSSIAEKLDSVSDKLEGLGGSLSSALDNFDSGFKVVLQQLKNSLQESTENIAKDIGAAFDGMKSNIEGTKDDVGSILLGLKSTMEELSSKGKDIADTSADQLRTSMALASENASKDIANAGKAISNELAGGAEEMSASISKAAKVAKQQIADAGKDIAHGFSSSTASLVNSLDSITLKLGRLETSLVSLPGQFLAVTESLDPMTKSMQQASGDIRSASAQFETAGSSLESTIEPLTRYVTDSKVAIESISKELHQTTVQVKDASASIASAVDILEGQISSQVKELSGSDEKLARLHSALTDATDEIIGKLVAFQNNMDKGLMNSIGILDNTIEEFGDTIDKYIKEKK